MAEGSALGKRLKISQSQQYIILAVLVASLALGVSLVLGNYFIKTMIFNGRVIGEKDKVIADYEKTIKNVGICVDKNNDGKFSEEELKNCDPENVRISEIPGSLRANVMSAMSKNQNLEATGRESLAECKDSSGKKINFSKEYEKAKSDEQRMYYLHMTKMCSALRAIPDALPAQQNDEALMASLNQIFLISDWTPEQISPSGMSSDSSIKGVGTIPVSLSVEASSKKTLTVLNNIERSIRTFAINSAHIEWTAGNDGDNLNLSAQAVAFYAKPKRLQEETKKIYASKKAEDAEGSKQ